MVLVRHVSIRSSRILSSGPILAKNRIQIRHFSVNMSETIGNLTNSLQEMHSFTGLPWWAFIPLSTFALRGVWTLPLALLQRKRLQKQSEYKAVVGAMNPVFRMNLAKKAEKARRKDVSDGLYDGSDNSRYIQSPLATIKYEEILVLAAKETRKRQKKLFKKLGIQLWKNVYLPAFQIPLWVSMSLVMRDLSGWKTWDSIANKPLDPSLYNEGALWFTDLTSLDPMHILPLFLGVVSLCNVEWTYKTLELSRLISRKSLRPTFSDAAVAVSRMSVVFIMAISLNAPTALVLYWLSSQVFSLIQNVLMDLMIPINFTPKTRFDIKNNAHKESQDISKL